MNGPRAPGPRAPGPPGRRRWRRNPGRWRGGSPVVTLPDTPWPKNNAADGYVAVLTPVVEEEFLPSLSDTGGTVSAMTRTGADYTWFEDDFPDLAAAYCLTLVRDLSPTEVTSRLEGKPEAPLRGVSAVVDATFDQYARAQGDQPMIALTTVGDWTLLIEPNGYLGVDETRALPASSGTTWVSHFVNVNSVGTFLWIADQETRTRFDPLFPDERWGSTPDALLGAMQHIGFPFGEDEAETDLPSLAAFALAEHLTGVTLTPALFRDTTFTCATVRIR